MVGEGNVVFLVTSGHGGSSVFSVNFFSSISRLLKVIIIYSRASLGFILHLERACRLIVTPENVE